MTSSVAVNILNLVPVFGVLGAVLINGETVRLPQAFGGVIIIAGVALGMVERRTTVEKTPVVDPTPVGERA
jgi:drug/metabolite transporter (DMT)-like permease